MKIDINCDMGESFGNYTIGNDPEIFPFISSCNIACGFHGGDPTVMENTVLMALQHGTRIGAHPGYPDLAGFGRRGMKIPSNELKAIIKYQIAALKGIAESHGKYLEYVKPHGALYNAACEHEDEINTILQAIIEIDPKLSLMGLAGSIMEDSAKAKGVNFIAEAFADRRYTPEGLLMSRSKQGAVISNPEEAVQQVLNMVLNNSVTTSDGSEISINPDSICIHGDNIAAVKILTLLNESLKDNKIERKS